MKFLDVIMWSLIVCVGISFIFALAFEINYGFVFPIIAWTFTFSAMAIDFRKWGL